MKEKKKVKTKKVDTHKRQNFYKNKHFKGNVQEGQGFADRKKAKIVRKYNKILKQEARKQDLLDKTKSTSSKFVSSGTSGSQNKKVSALSKAQSEFKKKQEQAEREKEMELAEKKAKEEALKRYKKKKNATVKAISRKNHRGQPSMASQMELLLAKIQSST